MKFACMSCGARYSIPDGRLTAAGQAGLRVRCSRCRAIMVVAESQRFLTEERASVSSSGSNPPRMSDGSEESGFAAPQLTQSHAPFGMAAIALPPADDATMPGLKGSGVRRRHTGGGDGLQVVGAEASSSGLRSPAFGLDAPFGAFQGGAPDDEAGVPAQMSASGIFRPLPGVRRDVTGVFFVGGAIGDPATRTWYAAIGGRPRGPFSQGEMKELAEKGKIRDHTLMWRPGFSAWKRVKDGVAGTPEDLAWLRKIVLARKLREREAQARAQATLGIPPVNLSPVVTRTRAGPALPTGAGMPPPLPSDASLPPTQAESTWRVPVAPSVAFAAGASGKNPLPLASLLEGASGDDIPVQWQAGWRAAATPAPRPLFARRPSTARAVLVGAGAGFVVLVTCAVLFGQKLVDALHGTGMFGDGP